MTPNETAERAAFEAWWRLKGAYVVGSLKDIQRDAWEAARAASPVMQNSPEGETRIVPGLGVITAVAAQDGLDVLDAMLSKVPEYAAVIEAERAEAAPAAEPAIVEAARKALPVFLECRDGLVNNLNEATNLYGRFPRDGLGRRVTNAEQELAAFDDAIAALRRALGE
jgi:hypothetical protein